MHNARMTQTATPPKSPAIYSTTPSATIDSMAKISVSLDDELYEQVRTAAGTEGVSGWLAKAASARLRVEVLRAVADEIARETGGPYTEQELREAGEWLPSSSTQAR
jgi:predicted transcriptional regulator